MAILAAGFLKVVTESIIVVLMSRPFLGQLFCKVRKRERERERENHSNIHVRTYVYLNG